MEGVAFELTTEEGGGTSEGILEEVEAILGRAASLKRRVECSTAGDRGRYTGQELWVCEWKTENAAGK